MREDGDRRLARREAVVRVFVICVDKLVETLVLTISNVLVSVAEPVEIDSIAADEDVGQAAENDNIDHLSYSMKVRKT